MLVMTYNIQELLKVKERPLWLAKVLRKKEIMITK